MTKMVMRNIYGNHAGLVYMFPNQRLSARHSLHL